MNNEHESKNSFSEVLQQIVNVIAFITTFLLAIELVKKSILSLDVNYDLVELFKLSSLSSINYLFIGWLGTMVLSSGSSATNLLVGLFPTGFLSDINTMSGIIGSRIGPDSVLLIVAIMHIIKSKKVQDGVFIPILEFFITAIVSILVFLILPGLLIVGPDSSFFQIPIHESASNINILGPIAELTINGFGNFVGFLLGGSLFFVAFKIFDLVVEDTLPNLVAKKEFEESAWENFTKFLSSKNFSYLLYSPLLSFFLGIIATALTFSASVSVSLLIPLYARKKLPLSIFIAFILGSNIGTYGDTLFVVLLTNQPELTRAFIMLILSTLLITTILQILINPLRDFSKILERLNKNIIGVIALLVIMIIPPFILFL